MVQIIIFGLLAILGLFGLSKIEGIDKKVIIIILILTFLSATLFSIFEKHNDEYKTKVTQLNLDFIQGKIVICQEKNISNKTFNITSNSFVAKQNSKYLGSIISFQDCLSE